MQRLKFKKTMRLQVHIQMGILSYALKKNGFWDGDLICLEQGVSPENPNIIKMFLEQNSLFFGGKSTVKICGEYII